MDEYCLDIASPMSTCEPMVAPGVLDGNAQSTIVGPQGVKPLGGLVTLEVDIYTFLLQLLLQRTLSAGTLHNIRSIYAQRALAQHASCDTDAALTEAIHAIRAKHTRLS